MMQSAQHRTDPHTFAERPRIVRRSLCASLLFGLIAAGVVGCSSGPDADFGGPVYPELAQADTLDIQVVRDVTVIRLTNTTANSLGPARLWVNRWFSLPVERFDVGQTLELSLWDFRDQYGESFQAGGFFSTQKPERLVLAQIETGGTLHGLVVVATADY